MNLLDLLRSGRLKINTPNGNRPPTYQDTIPQMLNVRFRANLSSGDVFDQYVRFQETGAVAGSPAPVTIIDFMVAENEDYLMTEDNNNLIVNQEII